MKIILQKQTPKVTGKVDLIKDKKLIDDIIEYCKTFYNPDCLGMAANQIEVKGRRVKKRFFVYDWPQEKNFEAIIEPEIIEYNGNKAVRLEACLAWPEKSVLAKRSESITVKYKDIEGNEKNEVVFGFKAQIFQHEIDHLDGKKEIIIDKQDNIASEKQQRNNLCKCGSGIKYKKCCINV